MSYQRIWEIGFDNIPSFTANDDVMTFESMQSDFSLEFLIYDAQYYKEQYYQQQYEGEPDSSDIRLERFEALHYTDGYAMALEYTWPRSLDQEEYVACIGADDVSVSCVQFIKAETTNDDSIYTYLSLYIDVEGGQTPITEGGDSTPLDPIDVEVDAPYPSIDKDWYCEISVGTNSDTTNSATCMRWQQFESYDSSEDLRFDPCIKFGALWHLRADLTDPVFEKQVQVFTGASYLQFMAALTISASMVYLF